MRPDAPSMLIPYLESFRQQPALFAAILFVSAALLLHSISGIFRSFARISKRRQVEDMPTSKIRSMALGTVELGGRVADWHPGRAPFSGLPAAYFNSSVLHLQIGDSGDLEWVRIGGEFSGPRPFCIEDGTGLALVAPTLEALTLPVNYDVLTGIFRPVPPHLKRFLREHSISQWIFIFPLRFRFRETSLPVGANCYIIGECRDNRLLNREEQDLCPALSEMREEGAKKNYWGCREEAAKFAVYIGRCSDQVHKYFITDRTEEELIRGLAGSNRLLAYALLAPFSAFVLLFLPRIVDLAVVVVESFTGKPLPSGF